MFNFKSFPSETQNAVPHWAFELNSATAVRETWDLKDLEECGHGLF